MPGSTIVVLAPTERAPGKDRRVPTQSAGPRHKAPGPDTERRAPTQRRSAGPRHSPDTKSAGPRHKERRARRSLSAPGAFCVGARRSFFVSGPDFFVSGPGALSGPGAPCVGARRCRGSASGPSAPLPRLSLSGPGSLCVRPSRFGSLWAQRSVCRGPALLLCLGARCSVSGPGALCVGARRSFYRALSVRCVWSPDCFCIGARRSSALSVSGPGAPRWCRRLGRCFCEASFLCPGPALFVSGPGALCRAPALFVSGPGALCRGPALLAKTYSLSSRRRGPAVLFQDSFCHVPAVCVSGPGAFCRGLCRGPAVLFRRCLCRGRRSLCRGPALLLCVGARRSLCRGPALLLCVGARRSVSGLCRRVGARGSSVVSESVWLPQLPSASHRPPACHPIRVPPNPHPSGTAGPLPSPAPQVPPSGPAKEGPQLTLRH